MKTSYVPAGHHSVTAYLIVKGAAQAIEFYKKAFGATEGLRLNGPGGKVMHAELKIGDSHIMLADEFPEMEALSPQTVGGSPVSLVLYVPDADGATDRAVAAGAKILRPIKDQFYGDRSATIADPFGHKWTIATHLEDLTAQEIEKRAAGMSGHK